MIILLRDIDSIDKIIANAVLKKLHKTKFASKKLLNNSH